MSFFKPSFDDDDDVDEFTSLPKPRSMIRSLLRAIAISLAIGGITALIFFFLLLKDLSVFDDNHNHLAALLTWKNKNNTVVYDQRGEVIAELFTADHIFYPYERLPKIMVQAILSIEDRNFWHHPGFDPKGIMRAAVAQLRNQSATYQQGASTITQQVVRYFLLPKEKTIIRKIKEVFLAVKLEKELPKEKIFEIYANSLFLGSGAYGVGSAAKRYFGKDLEQLQIHEIALIAGMFQAPSLYNPHRHPQRAKDRQQRVLYAMMKNGLLTRQEYEEWSKKPLVYKIYDPWKRKQAPYYVDYVIEDAKKILATRKIKNQGLKIYTTLDLKMQVFAEKAIKEGEPLYARAEQESPRLNASNNPKASSQVEAALLAVSPLTGDIIAMVGGRNYKSSQFNRTFQAMRQPGSAFKPIIYSLALDQGYRWSDVIFVSPLTLGDGYRPKNFGDEDYLTEATFLRAFYRSMNNPTLQIGEKLGLSSLITHAQRLGIMSPIKPELGSILGASEVTMFDMARMFSVFAGEGYKHPITAIREIRDQDDNVLYTAPAPESVAQQVLSKEVAYLMIEGMRQVLIRGTAQKASALSQWAVGKTGTSNDSKDNWFAGFSRDVVAVVWSGSDASIPLGSWVQGSRLALPVWMSFMSQVFAAFPPREFVAPEGVVRYQVDDRFGNISDNGINMWFLQTAPPSPEASLRPVNDDANFRNPF